MKRIRVAKSLFIIVFIFWVIETWWFGWNDKPINDAEKLCDQIVGFGLGLCGYLYLSPIFKWLEMQILKSEQDGEKI